MMIIELHFHLVIVEDNIDDDNSDIDIDVE